MTGVACAASRTNAGEVSFARAVQPTLVSGDSGGVVVCALSASTRAALPNARVWAVGRSIDARTDSDGCARLILAVGEVTLSVSQVAYTRALVPVTVRPTFVDTARAALAPGGVPSGASCREARRRGEGCL